MFENKIYYLLLTVFAYLCLTHTIKRGAHKHENVMLLLCSFSTLLRIFFFIGHSVLRESGKNQPNISIIMWSHSSNIIEKVSFHFFCKWLWPHASIHVVAIAAVSLHITLKIIHGERMLFGVVCGGGKVWGFHIKIIKGWKLVENLLSFFLKKKSRFKVWNIFFNSYVWKLKIFFISIVHPCFNINHIIFSHTFS